MEDTLAAFELICYNVPFLFIWGACWGSFLNVVLYRWPLGRSVVSPGSACPNCRKAIPFYDNIPVLSWFLLGGKCRNCKKPYSIRYALNEAWMGLLCAFPVLLYPREPLTGVAAGHAAVAAWPTLVLLVRHRKAPIYLVVVLLSALGVYLRQIFFA